MDGLHTPVRVLVAALALGGSMGAGCAATDGGTDTTGARLTSDATAGEPYAAADNPFDQGRRGDDRDRDDESLVPKTARQVAEGRGDLSYKATRDGFVYVIDNRDKKTVYEGPIDKDETITIAPYRNVIEINGKKVKRIKDLDNKHIHRIYFERADDRSRDRRDRRDRRA